MIKKMLADKIYSNPWFFYSASVALVFITFIDFVTVFNLNQSDMSRHPSDYKNAIEESVISFGYKNAATETKTNIAEHRENNFLTLQHEKVAEELRMRIDHEHSLFIYQFVVLGGLFSIIAGSGFLGGREDTSSLPTLIQKGYLSLIFGAAATGSLIIDIHIRYNSHIIGELGTWVKFAYEGNHILGWETYLGHYSSFHASPWFVIAVASLYLPTIIVLLGYYALIFFKHWDNLKDDESMARLHIGVFLSVKLVLIFFALMQNVEFQGAFSDSNNAELWNWDRIIWAILFVSLMFFVTWGALKKFNRI